MAGGSFLTGKTVLKPGRYYPGSPIRLTVNFTNEAGTATDPTTVTFKTWAPSGLANAYVYQTDAEVGKSAVGSYYADITPDEFGQWLIRWETTGTGTTFATEDRFNINYSPAFDQAILRDYW
jgi:hypothetical protein